jgi:hypothetical protein
MSSYLPPGVTDSMCDGYDPRCGKCGHLLSEHYDEEDLVYDSDGNVVSACDIKSCTCDDFEEGEYEPDFCYE